MQLPRKLRIRRCGPAQAWHHRWAPTPDTGNERRLVLGFGYPQAAADLQLHVVNGVVVEVVSLSIVALGGPGVGMAYGVLDLVKRGAACQRKGDEGVPQAVAIIDI